jgi:DNA-binding CsgD family transcriptional regulator
MKRENPYFDTVPSRPRFANAMDKLSLLQTEFVSEALRRTVDDVNAAMAHRFSEPLTALMHYLDEIKRAVARSDIAATVSLREIIDMAFSEVERICDIVERAATSAEKPADTDAAVARGREAIDMWAWDSQARAGGAGLPGGALANLHPLTPREQEVLALIIDGLSNKAGGHRLGISMRTFEAHRAHLMAKLGARNAADLIRKASSVTNNA